MSGLDLFWYICWYTKYSGGYRTKSVSGPIIHRRYSTAAWSSPHTTPEPCSSGRSVVPPLRLRGHREEPLDILVDGHDAQDPCGRQGVFRMHAVSPEDRPHAACATARGGSAPSPGVARSRRPPPRWRRSLTRPHAPQLAGNPPNAWRKQSATTTFSLAPFFLRRVHKGQRRQTATGRPLRNARQHRAHNPRNGLSGRHKKERSRHAKLCQPIRRKR